MANKHVYCHGCHRRECLWIFDLHGIQEMYRSYETHSFWPFLSAPTQGICVNFVRAEHSSYHWSEADLDRLAAYGHCVHTLNDAGLHSLGVECYAAVESLCVAVYIESPDHHTFCGHCAMSYRWEFGKSLNMVLRVQVIGCTQTTLKVCLTY